ncbi:hypothetical protein F511_47297 [Dorcoceras hygrometricum]|uniref:Uncharacterized protein n=1 Tax=Dorcoceras hygrometricum TaxID=472368 RepID=A0A2Z6ZXQ5_9LAMI|nr:hypothetical protein F511_47297 [Dorcoceras hygrometricum]
MHAALREGSVPASAIVATCLGQERNARPPLVRWEHGQREASARNGAAMRSGGPANAAPFAASTLARRSARPVMLARPARKSHAFKRATMRGAAARGGGRWSCRNFGLLI